MYNDDVGVDLADYALVGIYHDQKQNFAGLKLFDGVHSKFVADTPYNYESLGE